MADDPNDQPVMPLMQPGAMPNVGQASQQTPVLDPATVQQAQQQSVRPPAPRPILFDLFNAMGIGGQGQTNQAGRPVSRLDHFENFLGNFVQALGAGFANVGHGPGAAMRGAGAAMGAPYQQSLQNYGLQQQAQTQQAELQQRQAQTGLTQAETTKAGLESDLMRGQARIFNDPNLFQAMSKGQAPSNMEPDEQAVWNNAVAQASASRSFAPLTSASERIMQQRTVNARTGLSDYVPDADSSTKVSKVILDKAGNIKSLVRDVLPPAGYAASTTTTQQWIQTGPDKWSKVDLTSTSRKDIPGLSPTTPPSGFPRPKQPAGTVQPPASTTQNKTQPPQGTGGSRTVYGDGPIYAFDPKTKETVLSTPKEANEKGYSNTRTVTAKEISEDTQLDNRLADVATKTLRYEDAFSAPLSKYDRLNLAEIIANDSKSPTRLFGTELPSGWMNELPSILLKNDISPSAQKLLIAYFNTREAIQGYQRVLAGSSKSNELGMQLNLDVLPSPLANQSFAGESMKQFKENVQIIDRGQPRLPGVPIARDILNNAGGGTTPVKQSATPIKRPNVDSLPQAFARGLFARLGGVQ